MSYELTRNEKVNDTQFINISITDDLGFYNCGRWLTPSQISAIEADINQLTVITDAMAVSARVAKLKEVQPLGEGKYLKLDIRRAFRKLTIEFALDALLENNETFRKDWLDATVIDLNDPMVSEAITLLGVDVEVITEAIKTL